MKCCIPLTLVSNCCRTWPCHHESTATIAWPLSSLWPVAVSSLSLLPNTRILLSSSLSVAGVNDEWLMPEFSISTSTSLKACVSSRLVWSPLPPPRIYLHFVTCSRPPLRQYITLPIRVSITSCLWWWWRVVVAVVIPSTICCRIMALPRKHCRIDSFATVLIITSSFNTLLLCCSCCL